jgi:uncharacterized membrane protein (DUF106 family)
VKDYRLKLILTILSAFTFSLVMIITAFIVPLKDEVAEDEKKLKAQKILKKRQQEEKERLAAESSSGKKKLNRLEGIAAGMSNK